MKLKKIILWALSFLLLAGFGSYFSYRQITNAASDTAQPVLAKNSPEDEIQMLVTAYMGQYSRWPQNVAELQKFVEENQAQKDFDLNAFQGLTFSETSQKNLKIHYSKFQDGTISTGQGDFEMIYEHTAHLDLFKNLKLNPKTAVDCYRLGCLVMFCGDQGKAIPYFTKAISLKANYGEAYLTRGECFSSERKNDQAIHDLTLAIQFNKDSWLGLAYYARGQANLNKGNKEQAIQDFKMAMDHAQDDSTIYAVAKMELAEAQPKPTP